MSDQPELQKYPSDESSKVRARVSGIIGKGLCEGGSHDTQQTDSHNRNYGVDVWGR